MIQMELPLIALLLPSASLAFVPRFGRSTPLPSRTAPLNLVGIFYGTSTGSTETVASLIADALGDDAAGPFDVDAMKDGVVGEISKYDALIVGTPTWNTGADTERSGTGWDELYYASMQDLQIQNKKVAVFGLGDQESYGDNFADAAGELHDVFEKLGCTMMGYTSQEGYEHEDSKSIRGDKFCGLICDMANQEELSEERVEAWVAQLRSEGFFSGAGTPAAASLSTPPNGSNIANEAEHDNIIASLEQNSNMLQEQLKDTSVPTNQIELSAALQSSGGFSRHYNPTTKVSMWTSSDGRQCYYTTEAPSAGSSP